MADEPFAATDLWLGVGGLFEQLQLDHVDERRLVHHVHHVPDTPNAVSAVVHGHGVLLAVKEHQLRNRQRLRLECNHPRTLSRPLALSPPKSVTLMTDSTLNECTGVSCLSNAGENTPTLAYGRSIILGPFICASSRAGMKCSLVSGDGFLISSSAITPLGNAKVAIGSG